MHCNDVRTHLLDRRRANLSGELSARIDEHIAGCARCQAEDQADAQLSQLLRDKLESYAVPAALKTAVRSRYGLRRKWIRSTLGVAAAMTAGAALAGTAMIVTRGTLSMDAMVREATNDHLRILYSDHPLEVVSSSSHTVKPWFAGRLDFAPVVPFEGDDEFSLRGGSVAYFIDRKAAVYEYRCRLHDLSLFVFQAEGFAWPLASPRLVGLKNTVVQTSRGFNALLWRKGDLGYALVSDIGQNDLEKLGNKLGAGQ